MTIKSTVISPSKKKVTEKKDLSPDDFFKDFFNWPHDWMGTEEDLLCGERVLKEFIPFIKHLIKKDLARGTIKKYMSHLGECQRFS